METFSTDQSPFREAIDTMRFFPGGNRHEMLESLKSAVMESFSLITLTGDEGSGKSMICRMLEKELPEEYIVVFFPEMLESFEDVTRTIARKMEITLADGIAVGDVQELMSSVQERLSEKKQKILLIFDQAERIYLATLERIRKLVDIVNQNGVYFQILFSGNDGLLDNLKQLSMCNIQGAEEKKFTLGPLDTLSTYAYLNFSMKAQADNEVFSLEASEKIYSLSGGNIRKTNLLAEDSLKSLKTDSSFMVLLDNVRDILEEEPPEKWDLSFIKEIYFTYKKWIIPAGLCLVALFMIILWKIGHIPKEHMKTPPSELVKLSEEFNNIQKKEEEIERRVKNAKGTSHIAEQAKPKDRIVSATPSSSSLKVEDIAIKKSTENQSKISPTSAPVVVSKSTQPEQRVSEKLIVSKKEQKNQVEKIFNKRVAAAAKWLVGRHNNHYTIQLMVLASEDAENNLKRMLARKEYQDLANKLYILRKGASNTSILVFFGDYPTMVDARNARKQLPQFLLKHSPYAISIRGAIEKAIGG